MWTTKKLRMDGFDFEPISDQDDIDFKLSERFPEYDRRKGSLWWLVDRKARTFFIRVGGPFDIEDTDKFLLGNDQGGAYVHLFNSTCIDGPPWTSYTSVWEYRGCDWIRLTDKLPEEVVVEALKVMFPIYERLDQERALEFMTGLENPVLEHFQTTLDFA
jgi:hypothetical protein